MRVAVIGARGQLGSELCRQLGLRALPLSRAAIDLAEPDTLVDRLVALRPTSVINAAAYTQVDRAEAEPDACRLVNARAVERLAEACEKLACPLVQMSTDYVFGADGGRSEPYREVDIPGPLSVYGKSKLAGEKAAARHGRSLVVRTCGLYAAPSPTKSPVNFVATMLRLGRERREVRVVDDQRCTPSYVPHVAAAVLALLDGGADGLWHVVNEGDASWFDFAAEIFSRARLEVDLIPISTAEYASAAQRPLYSVLSTDKLHGAQGRRLPAWQEALAEYLAITVSGPGSKTSAF